MTGKFKKGDIVIAIPEETSAENLMKYKGEECEVISDFQMFEFYTHMYMGYEIKFSDGSVAYAKEHELKQIPPEGDDVWARQKIDDLFKPNPLILIDIETEIFDPDFDDDEEQENEEFYEFDHYHC